MNNRVQQRFDRSIREAVALSKLVTERESAHATALKVERYVRLAAAMRRLVERRARPDGTPFTPDELLRAKELLRDYERVAALRNLRNERPATVAEPPRTVTGLLHAARV